MYQYDEEIDFPGRGKKLINQVWSCNCKHDKKGKNLAKMHKTVVNNEDRCIYCGYYALKLEKSILEAKRSVLNKVFGTGRKYDMTNRKKK